MDGAWLTASSPEGQQFHARISHLADIPTLRTFATYRPALVMSANRGYRKWSAHSQGQGGATDPELRFSSREGREKRGPRKPERAVCEANGFDV